MKNLLRKLLYQISLATISILVLYSNSSGADLVSFQGVVSVSNQRLDRMRGGFITSSGLELSISIIKAVKIDGILQTVSRLIMPKLTQRSVTSNLIQPTITVFTPTKNNSTVVQPANNTTNATQATPSLPPQPASNTGGTVPNSLAANNQSSQVATPAAQPPLPTTPAPTQPASNTGGTVPNSLAANNQSSQVATPAAQPPLPTTPAPTQPASNTGGTVPNNLTANNPSSQVGTPAAPESTDTQKANVLPVITINNIQRGIDTFVGNYDGSIVVQNSKNGVTIQNDTTVNITTNAATLMRQMKMMSRLKNQLIHAAYH